VPAALPALLTTERLRLRAWQPRTDAEVVRTLWSERDPRAPRRIDAAGHPTVDELSTALTEQLAASGRTGLALLAVERRLEGDLIGYCGLITGRSSAEEPELAYELLRRVHGHGYATEAAAAVVAAAGAMGLPRLWATVRDWNEPSFRVLAKLGFVPSGRVDRDAERGDSVWLTRALGGRAPNGVEMDHERQHRR
jgi:RimJ/RimL family protein N-acetyltransferase